MANVAYVQFSIKSSDPEKLLQALINKGYIEGDTDELLKDGEGEAHLALADAYTGYLEEGYISVKTFDESEIILSGGAKCNGWFSDDDIKQLKELCQENCIELKEVTSRWYDPNLTKVGAQAWPVPAWIADNKEAHAYKDGFAYAHPDEDYDDNVAVPEETALEDKFEDEFEFYETAARLVLEALTTGKNPFNEDFHKYFPHCILYDYSIDKENLAEENNFDWDWSIEDEA